MLWQNCILKTDQTISGQTACEKSDLHVCIHIQKNKPWSIRWESWANKFSLLLQTTYQENGQDKPFRNCYVLWSCVCQTFKSPQKIVSICKQGTFCYFMKKIKSLVHSTELNKCHWKKYEQKSFHNFKSAIKSSVLRSWQMNSHLLVGNKRMACTTTGCWTRELPFACTCIQQHRGR